MPAARRAGSFGPGLYIVSTPIGNAADVSLRALDILAAAQAVACEDTRVTAKLLALHGIRAPLLPYHEHNAERMRPRIVRRLEQGETIALVSDAGTPLISDPGYKLVRACVEAGLAVTAVPGPSAVTTALVLSGLPTDRFLFAGFLPPRAAARRTALAEVADLRATLVFLEAKQRLAPCLADMAEVLGDRPAAVARELTKKFEEVRRATLSELTRHYREAGEPKGEITIVVGPPLEAAPDDATVEDTLTTRLTEALKTASLSNAVARVASETGLPRRRVYARALALKGDDG